MNLFLGQYLGLKLWYPCVNSFFVDCICLDPDLWLIFAWIPYWDHYVFRNKENVTVTIIVIKLGNLSLMRLTHLPPGAAYVHRWTGSVWFRQWLVACSAPSHYLNQYWFIINWTLRSKLQWNLNQNTIILIHENACENVVCETATILSRWKWVKVWSMFYLCFLACGPAFDEYTNGFVQVQDCGICNAYTLEILQSCSKLSWYYEY